MAELDEIKSELNEKDMVPVIEAFKDATDCHDEVALFHN